MIHEDCHDWVEVDSAPGATPGSNLFVPVPLNEQYCGLCGAKRLDVD